MREQLTARGLAVLHHPITCTCDACRVRRTAIRGNR